MTHTQDRFDWLRLLAASIGLVLGACHSMQGTSQPRERPEAVISIEEPSANPGSFRRAAYGLFHTLDPKVRIDLPKGSASRTLKVLLDGGITGISDWLDLSSKCSVTGSRGKLEIPHIESTDFCLGDDKSKRLLPQDPSRMYIMYPGQNRLRVSIDGTLLAEATFLCYEDRNKNISSRQVSPVLHPTKGVSIGADQIVINFPARYDSDASISSFLAQHQLRPQGLIRDINYVQVATEKATTVDELISKIRSVSRLLGKQGLAHCNWLVDSDPTWTVGGKAEAAPQNRGNGKGKPK